jgi:hypothetical protein
MTIVAIFAIVFILLHIINLICSVVRFENHRVFSLLEVLIPSVGIFINSLLLTSQFVDTNWLFAVSYSISFMLYPTLIPFVALRQKRVIDNVSWASTITMIAASVIGFILEIVIGSLM